MAEPNSSRRSETALAGLRQYGNDRQIETLAIVRKAIAALRLGGARVTLGSIAEATKPSTPTGRGLAESTILRNPACRDLYMKEAQPVRRQRRLKRTLTAVLENGPTESEAKRMQYTMRGTKEELAVQLIDRKSTRLNSSH